MTEPMPGRPIRNLTEWFDELLLEDKLLINKYMAKVEKKRDKQMINAIAENSKKMFVTTEKDEG